MMRSWGVVPNLFALRESLASGVEVRADAVHRSTEGFRFVLPRKDLLQFVRDAAIHFGGGISSLGLLEYDSTPWREARKEWPGRTAVWHAANAYDPTVSPTSDGIYSIQDFRVTPI